MRTLENNQNFQILSAISGDDVDHILVGSPLKTVQQLELLIHERKWADAAVLAIELTKDHPENAGIQRKASGALVEAGLLAEALVYALDAVRLEPNNSEFLLHAGYVLNKCGKSTDAAHLLLTLIREFPSNADAFAQLSIASENLGNKQLAVRLALRAFQLNPEIQRAIEASHIFARMSLWDEAVNLLKDSSNHCVVNANFHRTLSGFLLEANDAENALQHIDAAIVLEPDHSEYHLHRSGVLIRLKRYDEAATAAEKSLALDKNNLAVRRHTISILVECGKVREAIRVGGELLASAPDEEEYASCMKFLLEAKDAAGLTNNLGEIATLKLNAPPRQLRKQRGFFNLAASQLQVISALVLRDIRSRYGESKIGFFWSLVEPFVHIGTLAIVFQFTMHGHPPLGNNYFMFYFTGVVPYLLLSHLIMHGGHSIKDNRYMLLIPSITPFDILFAKGIVELFTTAVIYLVFILLFLIAGINAIPDNIVSVIFAFTLTFALGLGVGAFCTAMFEFGSMAEQVVSIVLRFLYFASGIFYVPSAMPIFARDVLLWNPFLHIIDLFRTGYFSTYSPHWIDVRFAIIFSLFAVMMGFSALALMSRSMRSHL